MYIQNCKITGTTSFIHQSLCNIPDCTSKQFCDKKNITLHAELYVTILSDYSLTSVMQPSCVFFTTLMISARERIVGWYHTGPKLHQNDVAVNELMRRYCPNSVSIN